MNNSWDTGLLKLEGAYSKNTIRAYRADFSDFGDWCEKSGRIALPASPETIAAYIEAIMPLKTAATINRRMVGIGRVHRLLGHANPAASEVVLLALRRMVRAKGRRQKQAAGLSAKLRETLIAACGDDLRGLRNQAMIAVGYDTLCRRSELVELLAEDIDILANGDASILIRRSKTDQVGEGRLGYLSGATVEIVERWQSASGISAGPLFRRVTGSTPAGSALNPNAVSHVVKTLARKAGLDQALCEQLSGHSLRVGAALDMAENGIDLVPIMHAGGWKSPSMVVRYTQQISLKKSGMAQLHAKWRGGR